MTESTQAPAAPPRMELPPTDMPRLKRPIGQSELFAARLERAIRRATRDRVRELVVEVLEDGIVINGRCGTFYCKQLAQQAVKPLIGDERLLNRLNVW